MRDLPLNPTPSMQDGLDRKLKRTLFGCIGLVAVMVGAAYAAVPLYSLFCKLTGFAGTPLIASENGSVVGSKQFLVQLDSNVAPGLAWRFAPEQPKLEVRVGETMTVFFRITNLSDRETTGMATYNVQPELIAPYFNKLQCFCFNEMVLKPHESVDVPVVFFIDPEAAKNRDLDKIAAISLSYTFFASKRTEKPLAAAKDIVAQPAPKL
jgi:cytochrome c oxidase assembly protein subunit 11